MIGVKSYFSEFNIGPNLRDLNTNIQGDILAGITVAMVVLPMALAFGVASGLGAISGLWSAVAAGLVAGPLSGSPWAVGGPTGPITIQVLTIAQTHQTPEGTPDLAFIFTTIVLAGLILIVLGLGKVGQFIRFTPYSVISGFMTGLGVLYILLQINPFLGLAGASSISSALTSLPGALAQMSVPAFGIGAMTIVVLIVWPRISPVIWLPSPLVALVVSTAAVWLLGLDIPTIGEIPTGLPDLHLPHIDLIQAAFVPAAVLAGLCVFDSLLTCLIVDNMTGTHHHSDQELIAQGSANIFS
ncbi:MAG: SulP family inorganic anion transporter, partial [Nitrospira sp.]|nr:SulP family inorganic anion transporter [Nitrospira sp.]